MSNTETDRDALKKVVVELVEAIKKVTEDAFGVVYDTPDRQGWFIRDELIDKANKALGALEVKDGDHDKVCPVCGTELDYHTIDAGHLGDTDIATCEECETNFAEGWIQPPDLWTSVNLEKLKSDYRDLDNPIGIKR